MDRYFQLQNVDVKCMRALQYHWQINDRKYMLAEDDRGKAYKIYVSEIK
jgi:hypothetical protein